MPITHNICPYTLKPLADIKNNREHIFPDAIGGVLDYYVMASEKSNSDLGTMIDEPLINSTLVCALRFIHGIKSRNGDPKFKITGKTVEEGIDVSVEITKNDEMQVHVKKPVQWDDEQKRSGTIVYPADKINEFVETFVNNHKSKGNEVQLDFEKSLGMPVLNLDFRADVVALKRALAKIAYVAVYELLGDDFLGDQLNNEWRKAIFGATIEEVTSAKLKGVAFDTDEVLKIMLPDLKPYEHAVSIARFEDDCVYVAVSLFGKGFHSLLAVASETSSYGLKPASGQIAICNTLESKTRFLKFEDHILKNWRAFNI